MKLKNNIISALAVFAALTCVSCGDKPLELPQERPDELQDYTGEKAVQIRESTVEELLSIKSEVRESLSLHQETSDFDSFVSDLESFRPRLEYIHMQMRRLPKVEQMVVLGSLAVATNHLEKDLLAMLAKSPGNDSLAMEVANLREQLSPIPLGSMLQRF